MKRVKKVKNKCANPLFEKWLLEWRDEAKAKSSPLENLFTKAVISLQKYPLPLETGRDCILLQNFGSKLCDMLDKKLKKHLAAKGNLRISESKILDKNNKIVSDTSPKLSQSQTGNSVNTEKRKKNKISPNRNAHNSDPQIVDINNKIVSDNSPKLSKNQDPSTVSAKELQKIGDSNNEIASVKEAKPIKKKFVPKKKTATFVRRSREHSMSPSGSSCGNDSPIIKRIYDIDDEIANEASSKDNAAKKKPEITKVAQDQIFVADSNADDVLAVDIVNTAETLAVDEFIFRKPDESVPRKPEEFRMAPYSFDVYLLVDTHETAGAKTKPKHDATISELNKLKTRYEVRNLKVGDFGWIARCRNTKRELILPYIVERKRMDDLASSIKDGRFHEQKFRLKHCGVPNIIYLIESHGKNKFVGLPLENLLQASVNSYIHENFQTKFTQNHRHSMRYLSKLTTFIYNEFKDKHLISSTKENLDNNFVANETVTLMEFRQFNTAASKIKILTVKEMFIKLLVQMKGISVERARTIVEHYPTPKILLEAFQNAINDANKLLADVKIEKSQKQLGPALSQCIFELCTRKAFEQEHF